MKLGAGFQAFLRNITCFSVQTAEHNCNVYLTEIEQEVEVPKLNLNFIDLLETKLKTNCLSKVLLSSSSESKAIPRPPGVGH